MYCKNCKCWSKESNWMDIDSSVKFGECTSDKLTTEDKSYINLEDKEIDEFIAADDEGRVLFVTGENFGCIHFEAKKDKSIYCELKDVKYEYESTEETIPGCYYSSSEVSRNMIEKIKKKLSDIDEYVDLDYDKSCLDGNFTANELRRIADAMDKANKLLSENKEK